MIRNLTLIIKYLLLFNCCVIYFVPSSAFSQTLSTEKLIEVWKRSDVHQTQKYGESVGDLLINFNEDRFNLKVKEVKDYLSKHDVKRLYARLFMYERHAYQKMNKPDSLNTPSNYLKIIKLVSQLGDEQLLSELYAKYAPMCEPNKKLYYLLKCIEIRERIGVEYFSDISENYYRASELLYSITNYKSSSSYAAIGLRLYPANARRDLLFQYILMADLAGASYLKINQPDSAIYYYSHIGNLINDRIANPTSYKSPMTAETLQIWQGVVNGGIGKAYLLKKKYDLAYSLLVKNLNSSITFNQWNDVAEVQNSLAKIDEWRGNGTLALSRYKNAYHLALKTQKLAVLVIATKGLSSSFEKKRQFDSAYIYHKRYLLWKEKLDKNINQSRLDIVKTQVEFENMQKTLLQSQTNLINQKRIRNSFLVAIVFLTTIALLLYNRTRLRMSLKNEKLEKARQKSEGERLYAQKQIDQFIYNIAEKNKLIQQLQTKIEDTDQSQLNSTLSNFIILTEDDWQQFKLNFETVNPNFISRLKKKMPQITQGEQRIVLLAKLGFTTKEMANATGVSSETIRSVSSRMRKKFNFNTDLQSIANQI